MISTTRSDSRPDEQGSMLVHFLAPAGLLLLFVLPWLPADVIPGLAVGALVAIAAGFHFGRR